MSRLSPSVVVLALACLAGAAARWHIIATDSGMYWPDEVYQSFEPAHAWVFGHGLVPWEFIEGARTWALPGLISPVLWLTRVLGVDRPGVYLPLVKGLFALLSLVAAVGVYRLALSLGAEPLLAALAGAAQALSGPQLYFSHRAMSENASLVPATWGLALLLGPAPSARLVVLGASLLGLSVLFRLQLAVAAAAVLVALLLQRRFRDVGLGAATLAAWAVVYGALDAWTWHGAPGALAGGWFHSAVVYVRFNLVEGRGAQWGTSPASYYAQHLWTSMPALFAVSLGLALAGLRRAWSLWLVGAAFVALHVATPHKEYRFLVPALPWLFAAAAVGASALSTRLPHNLLVAALALPIGMSAWQARELTFGDLGQYPGRERETAWDDTGPINRLLERASAEPGLCGVLVTAHLAWTGGSTSLHRKAPLYMPGYPIRESCFEQGYCSHLIAQRGAGGQVLAEDGTWQLSRIPGVVCRPHEGYPWRLP